METKRRAIEKLNDLEDEYANLLQAIAQHKEFLDCCSDYDLELEHKRREELVALGWEADDIEHEVMALADSLMNEREDDFAEMDRLKMRLEIVSADIEIYKAFVETAARRY